MAVLVLTHYHTHKPTYLTKHALQRLHPTGQFIPNVKLRTRCRRSNPALQQQVGAMSCCRLPIITPTSDTGRLHPSTPSLHGDLSRNHHHFISYFLLAKGKHPPLHSEPEQRQQQSSSAPSTSIKNVLARHPTLISLMLLAISGTEAEGTGGVRLLVSL